MASRSSVMFSGDLAEQIPEEGRWEGAPRLTGTQGVCGEGQQVRRLREQP